MRNVRLLSTTAAIVLLGAGAVLAQGTKMDQTSGPPVAQQNASAEKVAAPKSELRIAPETARQAAPTAPESNKKHLKILDSAAFDLPPMHAHALGIARGNSTKRATAGEFFDLSAF